MTRAHLTPSLLTMGPPKKHTVERIPVSPESECSD